MSFNPGGGGGIQNATDVAFVSAANNDVLTYNSSLGKWQDKPASTEPYIYQYTGSITALVGTGRVYLDANYEVENIRASVGTAPTGAAIRVDVNKNGTTIYTAQAARPNITVSTFTDLGGAPAISTFAPGDYMTIDVDQVGSTIPGSDLVVVVRLRRV